MNQALQNDPAPQRVLLATDLSARCDRAVDRAAQLTSEWAAQLMALNVLELSASPDRILAWAGGSTDEQLLEAAREQLVAVLEAAGVAALPRVVRQPGTASAIRGTASEWGAELVVAAVARSPSLMHSLLGSTVEQLAYTLPSPLLVVRNRPQAAYRRILVATDFSDLSRRALTTAARFFPGRELTLCHVHSAPMSGLGSLLQTESIFPVEQAQCREFLAGTEMPSTVTVKPVIESGTVEAVLTHYVRRHRIDLVVFGTHGQSGLLHTLIGSTAQKLLEWLPCDTLLVPEPGARNTR